MYDNGLGLKLNLLYNMYSGAMCTQVFPIGAQLHILDTLLLIVGQFG